MRFSIIIPTYNRTKYLPLALASLLTQTVNIKDFEVIVVDDGSTESYSPIIKAYAEGLNLRYLKLNHFGVSSARNTGIKLAQGEILVFFDDDAVADNGWMEQVGNFFITGEKKIMVGRGLPLTNNWWRYFAPHYDRGDQVKEINTVWECNLAVAKDVFAKVGAFDARIEYGHEGNEFARRALVDYKIWYNPQAIIYHDYAFGLSDYLTKQYKFGEKLAYLHKNEKITLWSVILHGQKAYEKSIENGGGKQLANLPMIKRLMIKIIARLGMIKHYFGLIVGQIKYSGK
ncbi:MAG: glycosyltransferase family A protein [bacterium]